MKSQYKPKFLSWCKSYEQEVVEMKQLIQGNPVDVKLLKKEYKELTGESYKEDERDEKDFIGLV